MSSSRKWSLLAGSGAALVGAGFLLNQETPLFPCRVALAEGTPLGGLPGTEKERTFIAIKPDGVHRALVGELIQRFERKGYTLVGLKLLQPTEEMAQKHYSDLSSKPFFPSLTKYFSSGPIVAMVWQGKDVVKQGRVILGATNPRASSPGTVRGDYCIDLGR
jgi:nucleoside-diphosphate kinase